MAQGAFTYNGQGFSLQGDKGRFVLPPQFRKAVKEASGGAKTLCIGAHEEWKCLSGFGLSRKDHLEAELDREEEFAARTGKPFHRGTRSMQLYNFLEIPFDDSGRFVIPDYLMKLTGISDRLYFQGAGTFIMMWSPDELNKMGAGWEGPQAACASLAAEAGKGRK